MRNIASVRFRFWMPDTAVAKSEETIAGLIPWTAQRMVALIIQ